MNPLFLLCLTYLPRSYASSLWEAFFGHEKLSRCKYVPLKTIRDLSETSLDDDYYPAENTNPMLSKNVGCLEFRQGMPRAPDEPAVSTNGEYTSNWISTIPSNSVHHRQFNVKKYVSAPVNNWMGNHRGYKQRAPSILYGSLDSRSSTSWHGKEHPSSGSSDNVFCTDIFSFCTWSWMYETAPPVPLALRPIPEYHDHPNAYCQPRNVEFLEKLVSLTELYIRILDGGHLEAYAARNDLVSFARLHDSILGRLTSSLRFARTELPNGSRKDLIQSWVNIMGADLGRWAKRFRVGFALSQLATEETTLDNAVASHVKQMSVNDVELAKKRIKDMKEPLLKENASDKERAQFARTTMLKRAEENREWINACEGWIRQKT